MLKEEPVVIENKVFRDNRGFFTELIGSTMTIGAITLARLPMKQVAQVNRSRSLPGVLRGLHYQRLPGQTKLVTAVAGKIWDVAVDIRVGSPTFGEYRSVVLDADIGNSFLIPVGFAHGFYVLGSETAEVVYCVDEPYNPDLEDGIRFDDPTLGIQWPFSNVIASTRDQRLPWFARYKEAPAFNYDKKND